MIGVSPWLLIWSSLAITHQDGSHRGVCKYVKQRTKPTKTGRSTHLSGRGRKMETKIKLLGDPHVTENQKNSSQEREQMFDGNEARGMCTVLRRHKLLVGAVVLVVVLASVGACVFLVSSSSILHHLGFTSKGIAKKSFASRLMSSTSQANNHTVPQDSWVPASFTQTCTNQDACLVSCEGCTGITMVHDPINCHRFYYCNDDQLLTDSPFECPNGQEFNPQTHACEADLDGEECRPPCASKGECHYNCQPGDPLIASLYDCGTYYACDTEGNFGHPKTCPPERPFFDGTECQTNETLCCHCHGYCFPGDEGRLVVDPKDCRRYYVCVTEGVPVYSGTCDKGEHFDAVSRQCSTEAPCRTMCRNVIGADGCIENFTCRGKGEFAKCPNKCFPEYYNCLEFSDTYAPAVLCRYDNYVFDPEELECVHEDRCSIN